MVKSACYDAGVTSKSWLVRNVQPVPESVSESRHLFLHQQNRLSLDFKPIAAEIAYHQPCHVRATLHPLKLLTYAYGRLPRVEKELTAAR